MNSLTQSASHQKTQIFAPVLLGLSILIFIFGAKSAYSNYIETSALYVTKNNILQEREAKHQLLSNKKSELANDASLKLLQARYTKPFIVEDIMRFLVLNQYTQSLVPSQKVIVSNISVAKGERLPNGLFMGSVNMNIQARSLDVIELFIQDMILKNTEYAFVLDTISLPIDTGADLNDGNGFGQNLSFGIYYYE